MVALFPAEKGIQETQRELAQSKDEKYKNDLTKTKHFGVWFNNDDRVKLSRDTYAQIDKRVHNGVPAFMREYYKNNPDARKKVYEDEECKIYSDEWCEKHRKECLENFDLNISYFATLDEEKFEKALTKLLKRRKKFTQIYDIYQCDNVAGIYVLVLDRYKQVYIGQTNNIKRRILQHWRAKKEFDKLIFGRTEKSILSIDSFGCLDTTRIFVLETWALGEEEQILVNAIDPRYCLNRTAGGIHDDREMAIMEIVANKRERELR